jgi:enoyl-CoA hydratase/carnithine racemase
VATVTLNRPERKNPLTFESYAELRDTFSVCTMPRMCAQWFSPGGRQFLLGRRRARDHRPAVEDGDAGLMAFTRMTGALVREMRSCPQPIIAAIEGVCAGAGAILSMASDLRYATPEAKTAFLFVRVGLAGCDMGACAILPRIIGQGRASELLYTGRSMSAEEGLAWGYFNQVLPPEKVLAHAQEMAQTLADGPAFAHAMTKKCLHQEWNLSIEQAIETEAEAQAICMQTKDFARAYEAFVAKQKPRFQGD